MSVYNLRPYIGDLPLVGGYIMPPYINTGGDGVPKFVAIWDTEKTDATASPSLNVVLPMTAGPEVSWGDGTVNNLNTHTYSVGGQYVIEIDDTNSDFRFNNAGDKIKILDVSQCNGLNITNTNVFQRCKDMTWSATDAPNIVATDLSSMFEGAEALNGGGSFSTWDTSNVTRMSNMFFGCFDFVGTGIEDWDVGSCTHFFQMFFAASSFNVAIGNWNMISAENIAGMFRSNTLFNVDIGAWNVGNVTQMSHVFAGAGAFNQDIGGWDVRKVSNMHSMFSGASSFNQDIGSWQLNAIFDLSWMFAGSTAFNQDISGWNVGTCANFSNMFSGASAFNQDLTGWDFSGATNLTTMLDNCGMSTANYDAFLINLDGQTITSGLTLGAQGMTYTLGGPGETARTNLINNDSMTFVGDSGV